MAHGGQEFPPDFYSFAGNFSHCADTLWHLGPGSWRNPFLSVFSVQNSSISFASISGSFRVTCSLLQSFWNNPLRAPVPSPIWGLQELHRLNQEPKVQRGPASFMTTIHIMHSLLLLTWLQLVEVKKKLDSPCGQLEWKKRFSSCFWILTQRFLHCFSPALAAPVTEHPLVLES